MKFFSILGTAALLVPAALSAQTVTVNKTATPDATTFNSIAAALAAVEADPAEPNVVQVTDSGVYEEVISINAPVMLEATAAERATIELLGNTNGTGSNGGIVINLPETMTTGSVKMRNFIILPAKAMPPESRLRTAIENQNNNLYLELDNVLITANNGNGEPLVTDAVNNDILKLVPSHASYDPNVIPFGAHGIVLGRTDIGGVTPFEGEGTELLLKDSILTHFRNDYHPSTVEPERFPTCIVVHNPYGTDPALYNPALTRRLTRIEGASGLSYARVGISVAGDLTMQSDGPRIQMRGHGNWGMRFDGPAFNHRDIADLILTDNSSIGIYDRGFGPIRWTLKNTIIFMTLNHVFLVQPYIVSGTVVDPAAGMITIEDSTLVGGRYHATAGRAAHTFRLDVATECDIHFKNTILGGKKDQPEVAANVISLAGNNVATAEGLAVIVEGPYALRPTAPWSRGPNATLPTNELDLRASDPMFLVTDVNGGPLWPASPDLLDVQNSDYATLNAEGGPLGGGADYVGPTASVNSWELY